MLTVSIHYGLGQHATFLTEPQRIQANKYNWLSQGFHVMSTNFGKVSIALFLLRIIVNSRPQKIFLYTITSMLVIINSVCVFTIFGQCTPTPRLWDSRVAGHCWLPHYQRDFAFFQGSFSALSDGALAIYPIFMIWNLQMERRLKIAVGGVMALGIVAMVAAVIKTIFLASLTARSDYTFDTISLTIWTNTEQYLIIIAACIPPLGPLLKLAMGKTPTAQKSVTRQASRAKSGSQHGNRAAFLPKDSLLTTSESHCYPLREYEGSKWALSRGRSKRQRRAADGKGSEDNILSNAHEQDCGGIIKTTEVHVESDKDSQRDCQI
ncbi:uncharacterized protein GIQ15_02837 [Arthroderma uncinatum]|uniref:uncharacterized protein n=1 Tax=Arthroderma uncinatum TaxID=74035 RepID=UPI00144AD4A4|nr:uncharacterized protein GIQ15_02837 [Arthroderma uncinatum]KAF3483513.1 integral membrane protein [Arthroderma uncinatum]